MLSTVGSHCDLTSSLCSAVLVWPLVLVLLALLLHGLQLDKHLFVTVHLKLA